MEDPGYESGYESEQDEAQLVGNYQEWIDAAEHLKTNEPGSWNDADWVQRLRVNHEYQDLLIPPEILTAERMANHEDEDAWANIKHKMDSEADELGYLSEEHEENRIRRESSEESNKNIKIRQEKITLYKRGQ